MHHRFPRVLAALTVALLAGGGCAEPQEAIWLEGAGFAWSNFNHRLSYWALGVDDAAIHTSVIGGTSTTEEEPELPGGCDPDTCYELPFWDLAWSGARLVQVTSDEVTFGRGQAGLVVGAAGGETTITVDLPAHGEGEVTAVIAGLALDTDHPLSGGEACYQPRYGWHPRRIAIELGTPTLAGDGRSVQVPVSAWFEAGESLEEHRQCVDEVNDQAQVGVAVDVQVIVGGEREAIEVTHGMTYAYGDGPMNPDEQPDPDWAERPLGTSLADPVLGWSRIDFRLHEDDPDDRGAYLRTLVFDAHLASDVASGHSTNYSPVSQLSGYQYSFRGTVEAMAFGADVARGAVSEEIDVALEDDGTPVFHDLALDLSGDGGWPLIVDPA